MEIRYTTTGEMLTDYQSKLQQRKLFCTMMAQLMNCPINYEDDEERR